MHENPPRQIFPHKTAISRKEPSKIARTLVETGKLAAWSVRSILDYGCGHGADVQFYRISGFIADGFDSHLPFGFREITQATYDAVMVVYVLNVLPTEKERHQVILSASARLKTNGILVVATRSGSTIARESRSAGWQQHSDGFLSSPAKGTFQKGIDHADIAKLLPERKFEPISCRPLNADTTLACFRFLE